VTERDNTRLVAWAAELRRVHARLREALAVTVRAVRDGDAAPQTRRDLLLYCHGFCAALEGHHQGEDRTLFPAIDAAHPDLAPVLRSLEQDHVMITGLLQNLRGATDRTADAAELERHLDGVAAIMENHFRYEERQLLTVLDRLELDVPIAEVLGPL
jgi:hypothetical protein